MYLVYVLTKYISFLMNLKLSFLLIGFGPSEHWLRKTKIKFKLKMTLFLHLKSWLLNFQCNINVSTSVNTFLFYNIYKTKYCITSFISQYFLFLRNLYITRNQINSVNFNEILCFFYNIFNHLLFYFKYYFSFYNR